MSQFLAHTISIPQFSGWLPWLLSTDFLNFVVMLSKLLRPHLAGVFKPSALYDVLNFEATIEVKDSRGYQAVYSKKQRLRFLKDNVSTVYDYGWGTGNAFASHRVEPGHIVERKQIGPRYRSLVMLPEPQHKGDELTLSVRRLIKDKFTGKGNWLEGEVYNKMQRMRLSVILPASRPVTRAWLVQRRQPTESLVSAKPISGHRQRLASTITNPKIGDMYTLVWDW